MRSGLVAEGHHGHLVVVDVQRPVQPVRIVVFDAVVWTTIVPYLIFDALAEPLQLAVGLRVVWQRVAQAYVEGHPTRLSENRILCNK